MTHFSLATTTTLCLNCFYSSAAFPTGITTDGTFVYYSHDDGKSLSKIHISTKTITFLSGNKTGTYADGTYDTAIFEWITDIAVNSQGIIYVMDGSNTLRKLNGSKKSIFPVKLISFQLT